MEGNTDIQSLSMNDAFIDISCISSNKYTNEATSVLWSLESCFYNGKNRKRCKVTKSFPLHLNIID